MKKLLVCLTILFSAFLFTNNVKAEELSDFCEYTNPCLSTENISTLTTSENYLIVLGDGWPTTNKLLTVININITDYENNKFYISKGSDNIWYFFYEGSRSSSLTGKVSHVEAPISLTSIFNDIYSNKNVSGGQILSYSDNYYAYYSTVDLYDSEGNLVFEAGLHNEEEEDFIINEENKSFTHYGRKFNLHDTGIENYVSNVNYQTIDKIFYDKYGHYLEEDENIDSFFLYYSDNDYPRYNLYFFDSKDLYENENDSYVKLSFHKFTNSYNEVFNQLNFGFTYISSDLEMIYFTDYNSTDLSKFSFKNSFTNATGSGDLHGYTKNSIEDVDIYYYTNANIPIVKDDEIVGYTIPNAEYVAPTPTSYNVTFHLNGGTVFDSNEICDNIGCYIIGSKYEDYSSTIKTDGLFDYLTNQEVSKETMQFVGWYYDEKLTKKVEATDILDSDKNFYAKYQYKNVEDFLNNNTFNSYTFDENYQYAVISLNDQTNRDIYLGLELMSYNFEVYKYNKINLEYHQGASLCLVPIFSKDNKYYYHLDSPLNEDYEVLILPKEKLQDKYNFLLSSNAYVTYTNDLKQVIIKDENGNDITTDLENSYDYSQDTLLNNENDLLEIFKDLINNKDNNVFSYFNQVWNVIKQNKLFIYFITLIIGALIILIIKTASR